MELANLQKQIRNWTGEHFSSAPSYLALIKVQEEVGELAGHFIKRIEHRVGAPEYDHQEGVEDSVADIVISLCVFCERENIDLAAAVERTWSEVSKRIFVMRQTDKET